MNTVASQVSSDIQVYSGNASLVWQLIFDRAVVLENIVDSARRVDVRTAYFQAFTHVIGATADEQPPLMDVLHVLECTHGAPAITLHMPLVALALSTAIRVLGCRLTDFAHHRNYAQASVYVASLIEDEMALPDEKRRTQSTGIGPRSGNPHLDVEDFLAAARALITLKGVSGTDPDRNSRDVWLLAQVICLARQHIGAQAAHVITGEAKTSAKKGNLAWPHFVVTVNDFLSRCGLVAPPAWRAVSLIRHEPQPRPSSGGLRHE